MSWLAHVLGVDNGSGRWYLWWSGFGANFQEYALIGAIVLLYRRHNCHVHRCPRIGRHQAGPYVVCRRHLPGGPPTAEDVAHVATAPAAASPIERMSDQEFERQLRGLMRRDPKVLEAFIRAQARKRGTAPLYRPGGGRT